MINTSSITALLPYLKDAWTMAWIGSGLLAIFIPVIIWNVHRASYFYIVGQYQKKEDYYEYQQWYYEQQQQQKNNYYNGNNGNNGNNNNGNAYFKECSWINLSCKWNQYKYAMYQNGGGDGDRVRQSLPAWYVFFGQETEEMERWREENMEGEREGGRRNQAGVNGGLVFAYVLTLGLFIALVSYGAITIGKRESVTTLTAFLVVTLVVGLMNLFMSISAISADDRDLEDSYYGWYGQTSVLLVYTNFWIMTYSFAFLVAFQVKNYLEKKKNGNEIEQDTASYEFKEMSAMDGKPEVRSDTSESQATAYHAPSESTMV